jgi:hypothetical protein
LGAKKHFRAGRHENKENPLFYFGLRILVPIKIPLLDIENPKIPKIEWYTMVYGIQKANVLYSRGSRFLDFLDF